MQLEEYRIVASRVNQGEDTEYQIMKVGYSYDHFCDNPPKTTPISWQPIGNIFTALHSIENIKINSKRELKEIMKAYDKPVLHLFRECLKEVKKKKNE